MAALIAHRTNIVVQSQLTSITNDDIPALIIAYEVSDTTTNIRSAAASVATSALPEQLSARRERLLIYLDRVQTVIDRFEAGADNSDRVARLAESVDEVATVSRSLAETIARRIDLQITLNGRMQELARTHAAFSASIAPVIDDQLAVLSAESERVGSGTDATVTYLNELSVEGLIPLLSMQIQLGVMEQALGAALTAETEEAVQDAWSTFVPASSTALRNVDELRRNSSVSQVVAVEAVSDILDSIVTLGAGDTSIFERRRAMIRGARCGASGRHLGRE